MSHDAIGQNIDDALETAREQIFKALEQLPSTPRRITFEEIQERQLIAVYEVQGDPFNLGMIGRVEKIEGGHVTVPGARWRDLNDQDADGDVVIILLEEARFAPGGDLRTTTLNASLATIRNLKPAHFIYPGVEIRSPDLKDVERAPSGSRLVKTIPEMLLDPLVKREDGLWEREDGLLFKGWETARSEAIHTLEVRTLVYPPAPQETPVGLIAEDAPQGFPAEGIKSPSLGSVELAPTGSSLTTSGGGRVIKRGNGLWAIQGGTTNQVPSHKLRHLERTTLHYPDWSPALAAETPALITSGELEDAPRGSILEHPWDDKLIATKAIRLWHLSNPAIRKGVSSGYLLERVPGWKFATLTVAK